MGCEDRGGSCAVADGLEEHAATRAGSSPRGKHKHSPCGFATNERVSLIDDNTGVRVESSPKAQGDIGHKCFTLSPTSRNDETGEAPLSYSIHGPATLVTRPRTADSTHSSVVAKTESTPSKPGP